MTTVGPVQIYPFDGPAYNHQLDPRPTQMASLLSTDSKPKRDDLDKGESAKNSIFFGTNAGAFNVFCSKLISKSQSERWFQLAVLRVSPSSTDAGTWASSSR